MTCKECKFWATLGDNQCATPTEGECRKLPPTNHPDAIPWPLTDETEWCGAFEEKNVCDCDRLENESHLPNCAAYRQLGTPP